MFGDQTVFAGLSAVHIGQLTSQQWRSSAPKSGGGGPQTFFQKSEKKKKKKVTAAFKRMIGYCE